MKRPLAASPAQARQIRQEFANPDADLDYELYLAVKKLPPLYTRLVGVTLSLAVFGAIAWAALSKVDEVAVAPGKIIPSEQVLPVQAISSDVIQAVKVQEGDSVQKGDILVELNPAHLQTEVNRLEKQAQSMRTNLNRATSASNEGQKARLEEASVELARQQDNLKSAQRDASRLRRLVGAVPRLDYDRAQDQVRDAQSNINIQKQKIQQLKQDYQSVSQTQLSQLNNDLNNVEGQLNQARDLLKKQTITAPIAGTVYNLNVNLGKGTLQSGEEILSIVPLGKEPLLEVNLPDQYRGFVKRGMRAKVKIETFPYQEFGTIDGTVVYISPNVVSKDNSGKQVFLTRIQLKKFVLPVRGEYQMITPGMSATGEIVMREKSILSLLLDPITRQVDDVFSVK
jgi:HlyD family secretion protein